MDTAEWGPHEEEEERRALHSRQGHRKKQPLTEEPPRSATPNRMRDFGGPIEGKFAGSFKLVNLI